MADIDKIIGLAATAINKVSGVAISGIAKVINQVVVLFTNTQAASKSITSGTGQTILLSDTNSMGVEWDQLDAFSISFWVKPGWTSLSNGAYYLFCMNNIGVNANGDSIRIWQKSGQNRLYVDWRSGSTQRTNQFWLFHANYGNYATAYAAAGLGSSYWSASNRGNTGDDDFTMITICKGTGAYAGNNNLDVYWNGSELGQGYFTGTNANSSGTPTFGNDDRQIALGSNTWSLYNGTGANAETLWDGLTMWDTKLTAAEVAELYNSGTPIDATGHSQASNLKGYWEFEGNGNATVGGEAFVLSGNSNIANR
tara:strand:+ start:62 stop:994 length:933 start_codon:yes stop_codon:yes gene_type:complete